jgi:hypothetical protein
LARHPQPVQVQLPKQPEQMWPTYLANKVQHKLALRSLKAKHLVQSQQQSLVALDYSAVSEVNSDATY